MPISYACAVSHAPGMTAWANAVPPEQKDRIYGGFERLRRELDASATGVIDSDFDHQFMSAMAGGNMDRLARYSRHELAAAGAGAFELLSWVALAGALAGRKGETFVYEAVKPWATGIGMMTFAQAVAA